MIVGVGVVAVLGVFYGMGPDRGGKRGNDGIALVHESRNSLVIKELSVSAPGGEYLTDIHKNGKKPLTAHPLDGILVNGLGKAISHGSETTGTPIS